MRASPATCCGLGLMACDHPIGPVLLWHNRFGVCRWEMASPLVMVLARAVLDVFADIAQAEVFHAASCSLNLGGVAVDVN